jgi:hypothetical protein
MTHIGLSPGWMSTTQLVTRFKSDVQMSDKQLGMGMSAASASSTQPAAVP